MQLMIREPRACLFPFGEPGATGDILEAMLGICSPDRTKDSRFSGDFAKNWGLTEEDLRELHARLEDLVRLVARLVQVAHHHDIAKESGCPKNAQEFADAEFPLQATVKVMEAFITPAKVSVVKDDEHICSVCCLSHDLAGRIGAGGHRLGEAPAVHGRRRCTDGQGRAPRQAPRTSTWRHPMPAASAPW